MGNLILAKQLAISERIYHDLSPIEVCNLYFSYTPDKGNMVIAGLNAEEFREVETETDLGWSLFYYRQSDSLFVVAKKLPKDEITVSGLLGWYRLPDLSQSYGENCYSSSFLGAKGSVMTSSLFEMYKENGLTIPKHCLLGDTYEGKIDKTGQHAYGVLCVKDNSVSHIPIIAVGGDKDSVQGPLWPIAKLNSDRTFVDLEDDEYDGSSIDKALKIIVR